MSRETLGHFELVVLLAAVRVGEEAYGITIAETIRDKTGKDVLLGSVYAALERLEAKGLVSTRLGEATPERGGKAKKHVRVTGKGLREIKEAQTALVALWRGLPALQGGAA